MFCMRRVVLFTALYALLSLDSLFWVGLFLDSNRSDNPGKHTVYDKKLMLDKVIETGKGQKVKAK